MNSPLNHHLSWMSMRLGSSAGLVRARRCERRSRAQDTSGEGRAIAVAPVPVQAQWHIGAACLRALAAIPLPESP